MGKCQHLSSEAASCTNTLHSVAGVGHLPDVGWLMPEGQQRRPKPLQIRPQRSNGQQRAAAAGNQGDRLPWGGRGREARTDTELRGTCCGVGARADGIVQKGNFQLGRQDIEQRRDVLMQVENHQTWRNEIFQLQQLGEHIA